MVTRLIYLLLFISPQVLLYLYLRERLPDPTQPRRARLVRTALAAVFAIFNLPWLFVASRALSGSMWGAGRIPYLGPWIAWQILGWIFCALLAAYIIGKAVVRGGRELGAVLLGAGSTAQRQHEPLPAPGSPLSRRRFLARATYAYAGASATLATYGIWSASRLPDLTRRPRGDPRLPGGGAGVRPERVPSGRARRGDPCAARHRRPAQLERGRPPAGRRRGRAPSGADRGLQDPAGAPAGRVGHGRAARHSAHARRAHPRRPALHPRDRLVARPTDHQVRDGPLPAGEQPAVRKPWDRRGGRADSGVRAAGDRAVHVAARVMLADRGPVPRQKYAVASQGPDRLASRPHPRPHARAAAIASQAASSASVTPAWFPGHSLLAARSTTSVTTPSHTAAQTSAAPGFTGPSALPCAMRLSSPKIGRASC